MRWNVFGRRSVLTSDLGVQPDPSDEEEEGHRRGRVSAVANSITSAEVVELTPSYPELRGMTLPAKL